MISIVAAAFLLASQTAASPPSPQDAPADPAADLATLQQLYDESCGSRGYGAYDDLCIPLTEQLREAKRAAALHPRASPPRLKTAAPTPLPARASLPPNKPMEPRRTQGAPNAPSPAPAPSSAPSHGASSDPSTSTASPPS